MAAVALQVFLQKLVELLEKEVQLLGEVQNDVRLLHDTLEWLHLSIRERDEICNRDEIVKLWVTQIRDAAFDAENIIDEYLLKIEQNHFHRDRKVICLSCIGKPFQWMALHNIGQKIKAINVRLDRIKANASEYGMKPAGAEGQGSSSSSTEKPKRRHMFEESDYPVGIGKDADEVAKLLVDGDETRRRFVVSISGMGGLGKTTLARHVYNRMEVKTHFQCSAWITVSQEFKVHDLLCHAISCITRIDKGELRPKDEEDLRSRLLECLQGKVYLVVLDDIWNIDAWNNLATSFPDEKNGSRVLLTTRNRHIARHVDPLTKLHELRLLTEEECWELLCKKAFPIDHKCPSHDLKEVGKKMVKKCGGLPLAVVVLGGLLSTKGQTLHEWTKVLDSISWQLSESDHEMSSILAWSYDDLPYYLKACFLHFASFLEDHQIHPDELIRTLVAEGFVKRRGLETLEDIAEDYLLELNDRNMIQIAGWDEIGKAGAYSIHDMLRDIAIKKAKEEKFLDVYGSGDSYAPITVRRLAFTRNDDINKCISLYHSHLYLRSLYCFPRDSYRERIELKNFHGRFKFLRVMRIDAELNLSVLDELGDLIHLRYIRLQFFRNPEDDTPISLPSTFSRLYNLQTLDLKASGENIYMHDDIWKMKELRHLDIVNGYFPEKAQHRQLSKLTNLQTLRNVSAGDWIKDDLGKMTSLRSLGIHGDLTSYQDALVESIGKLMNLRDLRLQFRDRGMIVLPIHFSHLVHLETLSFEGHMDALPPLQDFPANLTCLALENCALEQEQDPMAILEKLPKLRSLYFAANFPEGVSYVGEKMSCSAYGFPELRLLCIFDMPNLEEWIVEKGAMPKLKELFLGRFNKLKMIPEGFQHLNALQELTLWMDNDFLQRTEKDGEDWFKIKHIPLIGRHRG